MALLLGAGCPPSALDGGVDGGTGGVLSWSADRAVAAASALALMRPRLRSDQVWENTPPLRLDEEGTTGTIALEVSAEVRLVQVVARASAEGALVVPTSWVSPSGEVWVAGQVDDPAAGHVIASRGLPAALLSRHRVLGERTLGSWSFPATPDLVLEPGTWTLTLGAFVPAADPAALATPVGGSVEVAVLLSAAADNDAAGLPLVVHLAHGELTAASAPDDPVVSEALSTLDEVMTAAGVTLSPVSFIDVDDPSLRTVALEDNLCTGGDLDVLLGSATAEGAVHVFFVERFSCILTGGDLDVGDQIGGIAGGLPGPGPLAATPQSGIAVATAFADGDGSRLGAVLAHEVGHHFGLFHTKERSRFDAPDLFDIIDDTPDTAEAAAANLMYFVAQEDRTLSAGQREVIKRLALGARAAED